MLRKIKKKKQTNNMCTQRIAAAGRLQENSRPDSGVSE